MKKLRIDYLMMTALVLGSGMAMATRNTAEPKDALLTAWQRTAPQADQEGSWEPVDPDALCRESEKICKATFATGYDPNQHTENENETAAVSTSIERGYVPQQQ
ncbi:MAG TPA: hypothetical protein VGN64_10710 [Dyadobacter sp.]|jgi:hypothetical protein|nr:hypothetical protein [Dyadobacter sp.]